MLRNDLLTRITALAAIAVLAGTASATPLAAAVEPKDSPSRLVPVILEVHSEFGGVPPFDVPRTVNLRPGFRISVFAAGLGSPRQIAFGRDGVLFSANIWEGQVLAHPDRDGNGISDEREKAVFAQGLWAPHSLYFDGADLYVGAHDRVVRFTDADGDLIPDGAPATVVSLPTFGDQITRTVLLGPDRKLYVGIGSTTNADPEADPRRGAVVRYELDGSGETIFASGLRNPVGLAVHPVTGALWSTEVGADHLGEERPLEEINILQLGAHYGWPYCFEDRLPDIQLHSSVAPQLCPQTVPPVATFRAHTTPLGLTFYTGSQFPAEYRQRLFVALHGSSKRLVQAGYAVMSVEIGPLGESALVEEFATGWLLDPNRTPDQPGQNWGRPVQVATGPDGALYVSSDRHGAIYRIWHAP